MRPGTYSLASLSFICPIRANKTFVTTDVFRSLRGGPSNFPLFLTIRFHFHFLHLHWYQKDWENEACYSLTKTYKHISSSGSLSFCIPVVWVGEKGVKWNYSFCKSRMKINLQDCIGPKACTCAISSLCCKELGRFNQATQETGVLESKEYC